MLQNVNYISVKLETFETVILFTKTSPKRIKAGTECYVEESNTVYDTGGKGNHLDIQQEENY